MRKVLLLGVLLLGAAAAGAWWYWRAGPYVGTWALPDGFDRMQISRTGWRHLVRREDGSELRMLLQGDRLVADQIGTTLVLIYDPARDELVYPVFSDTQRRYQRAQ